MSSNNETEKKTHMNEEVGRKKKHGVIKYPDTIGPYRIQKTIGEGAFSIVKLSFNQNNSKRYACKIVPIHMLEERDLYKRFELEIRISQIMRHPGVAAITDVLKDENNFYVFMEYYPHGNLLNYIVGKNKLDEEEAKGLIYQIFDAIQYIHLQKVSHRDLKPENIMIDDSGRLRISDFGLSRFVGEDNLVKTPCGSPCYVSPECISGRKYDGLISDIWSCGVILYAMVTGMLPWTKRKMHDLFNQIKRGDYKIPSYVSNQCQNLIKMLLTVDPINRITLEQAKNHTWFTQNFKDVNHYADYSIPLDLLKSTNDLHEEKSNDDKEEQSNAKDVPYLSTRKVDVFFRPDVDLDLDGNLNEIANIHAINTTSQTICEATSPYLKFDSTLKILDYSVKVRKRRVEFQENSTETPESNCENVNLNIVSSSGQILIYNKLYTNEENLNSILADCNSNNSEIKVKEDNNKEFNNKPLQRRERIIFNLPNRRSAKLPGKQTSTFN